MATVFADEGELFKTMGMNDVLDGQGKVAVASTGKLANADKKGKDDTMVNIEKDQEEVQTTTSKAFTDKTS